MFDTAEIPWWAWVKRFHLPEVSCLHGKHFSWCCCARDNGCAAPVQVGGTSMLRVLRLPAHVSPCNRRTGHPIHLSDPFLHPCLVA